MEKSCICVYRDTIEAHDDSCNLTSVEVTKKFVEQYFNERKSEYFDNLEDFLNEYTADDTEDFYGYAMKHHEVIAVEHW